VLDWDQTRAALTAERLPALVVDLEAFDRNVERVAATARGTGKTVRVGSKSIRSLALLRRILDHDPIFRGVLAFDPDEAAWLLEVLPAARRDVLVAYPSLHRPSLERLARAAATERGLFAVDSIEHLEALAPLPRPRAVIDLDVSLHLGARAHLGVRRSPLRTADDVAQLLERARRFPSVELVGLLAYEAHIAGLPGHGIAERALRRAAFPAVAALRREAVRAMRDAGIREPLVNAGGTGSLGLSLSDPSATEVTVGSGFLCSHLFDGASDLGLEPALFIALEVCRVPDADHITVRGGGYIASGEAGPSRLPVPHLPRGMRLVALEGAGEVQTPLFVKGAVRAPRAGDPVLLRPAKAGEIAERFAEHLWLSGGRIVGRTPTYRGEGRTFL
jgi:D-serine deaminase-like pyridoxal phosphate-dependent protein